MRDVRCAAASGDLSRVYEKGSGINSISLNAVSNDKILTRRKQNAEVCNKLGAAVYISNTVA